jgi:hypothetical protein
MESGKLGGGNLSLRYGLAPALRPPQFLRYPLYGGHPRNAPGINHGPHYGFYHEEPQIMWMSRFHNLMLRVGQTSLGAVFGRNV